MTSNADTVGRYFKTDERPTAVLCLDLDGTVREGKDDALGRFVNGPEDVRVFPQAVEMMRLWKRGGGARIVGVSNQGGVALGIVKYELVAAAMIETQRQCGELFDLITFCVHHPDAKNPEMARCWCRKPSAGAVVEAIHGLKEKFPDEYYPPYLGLFVGDRPEDEACAKSAGFEFEWAADWRAQAGLAPLPQSADPERVIDTWLDAFQEVDMVSAAVAHHHATGHPGGSDGESYWCDGCEFGIERGWVVAGGMIRTLPGNA
jgi:D-glycero-D-manno-heptose 1,7-bisphosphate phosphatase